MRKGATFSFAVLIPISSKDLSIRSSFGFNKEAKRMSGLTRRRLTGIGLVLTLALVSALMLTAVASAKSPIVNRVSVGGPDACEALGFQNGCDANFSLSAKRYADGTASGQYTDRFAGGDGFHAVIDCLVVVGNEAWVSGVITQGTFDGEDLAGLFVAARVVDNGTSANDPPDQISFSIITFAPISCNAQANFQLLDAPDGQVKVS